VRRLIFLMVLVSACAASEPWPAHYLSAGIDRLTQDEIKAQLGPADETHSLPDGAMEWHYHYSRGRSMVGAHGTMGSSASLECEEYILTFNQAGVLRDWIKHMEPTCEPHTQYHPTHESTRRS
jgi:hypothetical protein